MNCIIPYNMKKILRSSLAPLLLIPLAAIYFYLMALGEQVDRNIKFEKCIEAFPSDAVCDSCYTAIYHKESKF